MHLSGRKKIHEHSFKKNNRCLKRKEKKAELILFVCREREERQKACAPDPSLPFHPTGGAHVSGTHWLGFISHPYVPVSWNLLKENGQPAKIFDWGLLRKHSLRLGCFLRGGSERCGLSEKIARGQLWKQWLFALSRRPWLELPGAEWSSVCKLPGDRWRGGQPVLEAGAKKTSFRVSYQGNSIAGACTEVLKWKVGRFCSLGPG